MSSTDAMPEESAESYLIFGSIGSVMLALYEYYVRDNRQRGIFIGLWPPTMIGFAIYLRLHESDSE